VGLYVRHRASLDHDTGPHPENARRILALEAAMADAGWLDLEVVEAPAATRAQLERVHAPAHIDAIEELCRRGGGMVDMDTVASPGSYEAALRAAGGAVHAADRLLAGAAGLAFCALRPPGHHAEPDRAMGFCLFNNVAVAAAHALDELGAERVIVVDWDVHHGNGTQACFWESERVLYASLHQSPLYPGTGAAAEVGAGAGEGFTINMPLAPGSGPDEFLSLVQGVVAPVIGEFRPDLVAISAGYDAHRDDQLAQCALDEAAYADMAASVRDAAAFVAAPVLVCLEGGYELDALARSALATIRALAGDEPPRRAPAELADGHRRRLARYWPSLA
jgi:acetoin utilization deacetylase AcuC-like enzyme